MSGGHLSKEFFELVKAIGESKSKQEEDRIIMKEVAELEKKLPEKGMVGKKLKELLVRLIYVEMLGHDGSALHQSRGAERVDQPPAEARGLPTCSSCCHRTTNCASCS